MVDDWVIKTMYATKRRRRVVKSTKRSSEKVVVKSNPSKRHRERLNGELDHLAALLPFDQTVIAKLDKLSILRLAVSYLRIKSFFHNAFRDRLLLDNRMQNPPAHYHAYPFDGFSNEGDASLQALNGFLFIVTCDGEVFFASRTVEYYLGFHQSDIIHQSVLELIHSEDREEFKRQLSWRHNLPKDSPELTLHQIMTPEYSHHLERCFTVRFRCLLDNTSGFITLEISGRIQALHGQSSSSGGSGSGKGSSTAAELRNNFGLFAVCSPFGPMPTLDAAQKDLTFKTKHKLDFNVCSLDVRAKVIFGYSEKELTELRSYSLLHPEDLNYVAKGHAELLKNGFLGFLVYRWISKVGKYVWLQSSLKILYKAGKQDAIICTHRQLTEEEGSELMTRRNAEYKLPFPLLEPETSLGDELDNFGTDSKLCVRKQRNQLKDYLQASRKRKTPYRDMVNGYSSYPPFPSFANFSSPGAAAAAAVTVGGSSASAAANFLCNAYAAGSAYANGSAFIPLNPATADNMSDPYRHTAFGVGGGAAGSSYYSYMDSSPYQSIPLAYAAAATSGVGHHAAIAAHQQNSSTASVNESAVNYVGSYAAASSFGAAFGVDFLRVKLEQEAAAAAQASAGHAAYAASYHHYHNQQQQQHLQFADNCSYMRPSSSSGGVAGALQSAPTYSMLSTAMPQRKDDLSDLVARAAHVTQHYDSSYQSSSSNSSAVHNLLEDVHYKQQKDSHQGAIQVSVVRNTWKPDDMLLYS